MQVVKKIFVCFIALIILFSSVGFNDVGIVSQIALSAKAMNNEQTKMNNDSSHTPIESINTISMRYTMRAAEEKGDRILLIQNSLPWDSDANIQLLQRLQDQGAIAGFDVCSVADFGTLELAKYSVISIANDQTTDTYEQCAAIIRGLEFFVQGGGVVIFGACDRGWGGNGNLSVDLPCGVQRIETYQYNNYIMDSDHPIVTCELSDSVGMTTSSLQNGNYCSHTSFDPNSLPEDANVILCDENQNPTLVEYAYGDGVVIASGLTWEFYYTRDYPSFSREAMDDLYLYALSASDLQYDDGILSENSDYYILKVTDSNGNPIKGAEVNVYSFDGVYKYISDDKGIVKFLKIAVGKVYYEVVADGYIKHSTKNQNYEFSKSGYDIVVLYSDTENVLKLRRAIYYDTYSDYQVNNLSQKRDLTYQTKRLSKTNESIFDEFGGIEEGYFKLICTAIDPDSVSLYEIWQNTKKIATSSDGVFNLKISDFDVGKNIFVKTLNDNDTVESKINLEICKDSKNKKFNLEFGEKIKVSVPDDTPFIGGTDVSFAIPDLPVEFNIEDGKLYVRVNIKDFSADTQDGVAKEKTIKEQAAEIKELMEDVKKLSNYKVGTHLESNINKFLKKREKFDLPAVGNVDVQFFGFGEVEWSEGMDKITFDLCVLVDGSVNKTWQTMVSVVPVVIDLTVGAKINLAAEASYMIKAKLLNGDIKLSPSIYLNAFGGVGVGKFIGVGVYGDASLDAEFQLIGTYITPGLNTLDLTGELGLKAYAGPFEYSKDFAHNTWHIYTRNAESLKAGQYKRIENSLYNAANYSLSDLSYLENESDWLPVAKNARFIETYTSIDTLLYNTYRNPQPTIVSNGKNAVLVYVGANNYLESYNATSIMYSLYDDYYGQFVEPIEVNENFTYDSMPFAYATDDDIFVAYQDTAVEFNDETFNMEAFLSNQDIVVAALNADSGTFDVQKRFSDNSKSYRLPQMINVGDKTALVWLSSDGVDMFGQEANDIMFSLYENGEWNEPSVLFSEELAISDYTVTDMNGKLTVVCLLDKDNDSSTIDDKQLIAHSMDDQYIISEGNIQNVMYEKMPFDLQKTVLWIADSSLYCLKDGLVTPVIDNIGTPESISVLDDKLLVTLSEGEKSEVFAYMYDNSLAEYGECVKITNQDKYIENIDSASFAETDYVFMTRKSVMISEGVEDFCELSIMKLRDLYDLSISGVEYSNKDEVAGGTMPVTVYYSNSGTVNVDNYQIVVKDSNENILSTIEMPGPIKSGEMVETTIDIPLKDFIVREDYSVELINTDVMHDETIHDNSAVIPVGFSNLTISVEMLKQAGSNTAAINIKNDGSVATDGILKMSSDGEIIETIGFDSLDPDENQVIMLELEKESFKYSENILDFYVSAYRDESYVYDNYESAYLDFEDFMLHNIESVNITEETVNLDVGETINLEYDILPDETEHGTVYWFSSDDSVATVDNSGNIIAVSKGSAKITVQVDGKQDSCVIMVACSNNYIKSEIVPSTCTEDGYTVYVCEECGETMISDVIEATGHDYVAVVTKPTCTEKGYTTYVCACGDSYIDNYIDVLNHTEEIMSAKDATCTETGITEGKKCSACDEILVAQEEIPAKGHDYVEVVTAPACTEQGFTTYTCACGDTYDDNFVDAKGHTLGEWEVVIPAQVGTEGREHQKCVVCDTVIYNRSIPAQTHKTGDANGDGKITAADARIVLRISAKLDKMENYKLPLAVFDATGDNKLTAADARKILRISAKLE